RTREREWVPGTKRRCPVIAQIVGNQTESLRLGPRDPPGMRSADGVSRRDGACNASRRSVVSGCCVRSNEGSKDGEWEAAEERAALTEYAGSRDRIHSDVDVNVVVKVRLKHVVRRNPRVLRRDRVDAKTRIECGRERRGDRERVARTWGHRENRGTNEGEDRPSRSPTSEDSETSHD